MLRMSHGRPLVALQYSVLALAGVVSLSSFAAEGDPASEMKAEVRAVVSAPSMKPVAAPVAAGTPGTVVAPVTSSTAVDVPWALDPNSHPYPLRFEEAGRFSTLYLSPPSVDDSRVMLPGRVADAIDYTRVEVNKYFVSQLSIASQVRGKQLEALSTWLERTEQQARGLKGEPWEKYQFSLEARTNAQAFRDGVAHQGEAPLERMVSEVRKAVGQLSPLMEVMPTHELQLGWYNILLQLKDGVAAYQTQVQAADAQLLEKVDDFLKRYPAVEKPAGDPPVNKPRGVPKLTPPTETGMDSVSLKPAKPAAEAPKQMVEPSSSTGYLVLVGAVALAGGVLFRIRSKMKKGGSAPKAATSA